MLAIFFYVGVEVTIQSNLGALLKLPEIKGLSASQISPYISLYWGSLMIGRWRGSVTVFNLKGAKRTIVMTLVPLIAFGVICGVNYLRTNDISDYKFYIPYVILAIIAFFMSGERPAFTLILFASLAAILMLVGLFTAGNVALFSFISGGLFCSVMWPCIFALAIAGLGKYTTQGSSLLIMMILGGAIIPPLQGLIVDHCGAHVSYWVPVFCFAYLAFYGFKVRQVFKKQGMDADKIVLEETTPEVDA
jgi:FHS family L-fucose permease-like MFS transporter